MTIFLFIVFAFISAVTTTAGLFLPFDTGKIRYASLLFVGIIMIIGTIRWGNLNLPRNPTRQDVLDGRAVYRETQIITNNDTIKTYDIIWKRKN